MQQSTVRSIDLDSKTARFELGMESSTDSASDCRSRLSSCSSVDSSSCSSSSSVLEIEMMKEKFAKLLLGEDMSGSGNGVCSALAISNAITNLCVAMFGQLWRLEPLPAEKKVIWKREMEWFLSVIDHIVELIPSWQIFPDGTKLEIMTCKPRLDLFINIPALRKLDDLLIQILDNFKESEFWYVDLHKSSQEKWWLPVPRLPPSGLHESTRKKLHHKRECSNQIMKAAMAINSMVLAEMELPESYLETLPKTGRACLGDLMYRYISSDRFSSEFLLDFLDLSVEHHALDITDRIEAAIHVWRRSNNREALARRAENVLLLLKQRFPNLTQTSLEISKILHNKDVGKSILESYSRVLESLAFNIVARIDDVLYIDDLTKESEKKRFPLSYSVPVSNTPRRSGLANPNWSPASPAGGERTPFLRSRNPPRRGDGVRRALSSYLGAPAKVAGGEPLPETCAEHVRRSREKKTTGCLSMSIG